MAIFAAILLIFVFIFLFACIILPFLTAQSNGTARQSKKHWCEDLRKGYKACKTSPTGCVYDWKVQETWEDYPSPDYNAVHTYCSIAFDDSGKTFYYRTRNPELQVGDFVYVPVGARYKKRMGRIVRMQDYVGRRAPYPLERTKHVIGKVEG